MAERKKEAFSPPAVGGSSLLAIFVVLCLTVFALLSLSTARADARLSEASAQSVEDYYAADCRAQETLAWLRAGMEPENVTSFTDGEGTHYSYTESISDRQELQVEVILKGRECVITRWQSVPVGDWESEESITVWDGTLHFEGGVPIF